MATDQWCFQITQSEKAQEKFTCIVTGMLLAISALPALLRNIATSINKVKSKK
jgi:hypothetical protein